MYLSNVVLAALLSLSQTNPGVKISFIEAPVDRDVAMTERYIGAKYEDTVACAITFDQAHFAKAADDARKAHVRLSREKFRDFVVLHEMAHCFDALPVPPGSDAMEWREFLADVYAGQELVATGAVTNEDYDSLIKFRQTVPDAYKRNALQEVKPLITERAIADTSAGRIVAAKDFRSMIFSVDEQPAEPAAAITAASTYQPSSALR